jgi:hypothetical protein
MQVIDFRCKITQSPPSMGLACDLAGELDDLFGLAPFFNYKVRVKLSGRETLAYPVCGVGG